MTKLGDALMTITYDYFCNDCEKEFTAEQSIKDEPLTKCLICEGNDVFRLLSKDSTFILKGSGWFSDLYSTPTNKKE